MSSIFIGIYNFFRGRKILMWILLVSSVIGMALGAIRVSYVEDITSFFPQSNNTALIFQNLKVKDKIAVMLTLSGEDSSSDIYTLMDAADKFAAEVNSREEFTANAVLTSGVEQEMVEGVNSFVYDNLPVLLSDEILDNLDSLTSQEALVQAIERSYSTLISPIGGYVTDNIYTDPLNLGSPLLKELQVLGEGFNYSIIDNYIFSHDEQTLIMYITPLAQRDNSELITAIESTLEELAVEYQGVECEYFGAPAVAEYNARQIKWDSIVTLNIAILIIIVFITLAFRNRYAVLLVLTPVLYGVLFSLSLVYLLVGSISMIAVGSGSIIFGLALSYSIHVLAHTNHCSDIRKMIKELAYPLTIGSFTTIGAFIGLLFTDSKLLQDFGLFSALTLIGTTLYTLIFLPHFLKDNPQRENKDSWLLKFVDRVSNVKLDRNKPLVWATLLCIVICGAISIFKGVGFDSDMMNLNFQPDHLVRSEQRLQSFVKSVGDDKSVMVIASDLEGDMAARRYVEMCMKLDSLAKLNKITSYSGISAFIVPEVLQRERIDKWNEFWSVEKRQFVAEVVDKQALERGFDVGAFSKFNDLINRDYSPIDYAGGELESLFADWVSISKDITSYMAQIRVQPSMREEVYESLSQQEGVMAADRAFFTEQMVDEVNTNFYLVLYISGLIVFFALILSYGRIELALLSFLPMFISWIMILGIMSLLGIEFNIVTIILSTFIFGIGDDFSIFMMDGMLSEYRDKSKVLKQHRMAIFFSVFTIVVGMGALIFSQHPAMYSLGVISLIGIVVVVLITYTIQPLLFRLLIFIHTKKGGFPFTLGSILNTTFAFTYFVTGCFTLQGIIIVLYGIPIKEKKRKKVIHYLVSKFSKSVLVFVPTVRLRVLENHKGTFDKPAVVIANHQSFIDILLLLGMSHKFVMVTNGWVWHSPFFGRIVRYLGFYHAGDGYEGLVDSLQAKVKDGYSVVVFPEGSRSADRKIKRFHKGAFYLADKLELDIIPVLIYGTGLVSSKSQPIYIKHGDLIGKVLPRISASSTEYGVTYSEKSKGICRYFRAEYHKLYEQYNRTSNSYFRDAIIKSYIYKGPVVEWYMRIKLRIEKWYDLYDRLLPRKGVIVDLGCGYGAMSYMLMMLSDDREIVAIDYDKQKVEAANNSFLKSDRIEFQEADIREFEPPMADAIIISDVLHYIDLGAQKRVIERCCQRLNPEGFILIRDGNAEDEKRHLATQQTEKWSTEIVKFNKSEGELHFFSKSDIEDIAKRNNMKFEIVKSQVKTSNTLYKLSK